MKRERDSARGGAGLVAGVIAARNEAMLRDQIQELGHAIVLEQEQRRIDRINELPMGHPDNEHKLGTTFGPILAWMDTMAATGHTDALLDGTAVMQLHADSDEFFPLVASFIGVCDIYELIAADKGVADEGGALRRLARKIEVAMPVFQYDLDAARASIAWMTDLTRPLTPRQFSDYSVAIEIRAAMAEINERKKAA